ncbi:MAG TPA: cation diffusion facilitator family transporter [Longimicrobium sp.]
MKPRDSFHPPAERVADLERARRLEWITIGFALTAITAVFMTMGSSQAMKTAWIEDVLGLIPPAAFLIATRLENREPDPRFPYGFHRSLAIAFLCASVALAAMGAFLLYEAVTTLMAGERPTIGTVELFGRQIWLGWAMVAALVYSAIPQVILGRIKGPIARRIHDKALHADADMNRADWLTAVAAIGGIVGIGFGFWWADAAAAAVIALDVLHDGWKNLAQVIRDLMDERPTHVGSGEPEELPARMRELLHSLDWVADADVRLREEGHVFSGEVFVVPHDERDLVARLERVGTDLRALDWRLYDLSIVPVRTLERPA